MSLVLHLLATILGIPPGTVVISQKAVNATLAESHEMVSASVCAHARYVSSTIGIDDGVD